MALPHIGSWGLPDFGLTEALTNRRTTQGGSNLMGSNQQASTGEEEREKVLRDQMSLAPEYSSQNDAWNNYLNNRNKTGGNTRGTPVPAGFNPMDRNQNPGEGWFYDAADGWKQTGGSSYDAAAEAARRAEEELRNTIGFGFDQVQQGYGNLIPFYENQQGNAITSARGIYDQIAQGLGQTRQTALDKLGIARGRVGANVANSTQDLQKNLAGVIRNTGMQLGAMGAGDTSASNIMAPYAYTKMAGQEFGKIQRQGNDQLFQIETQERDTENQYNQMINQANIEKEQQLQEIRNQYGGVISQIRQRMAEMPAERAQAMAGLLQNTLADARTRLANIENYHMNMQSELQNWAQNRMAQLNDAKIQLNNSANFNPQDIVYQELQSRNIANPVQSAGAYWNPEIMKKRREELGY